MSSISGIMVRSHLTCRLGPVEEEPEEGWSPGTGDHLGQNYLKLWWSYTRWFWVLLAFVLRLVQATATANMSAVRKQIIDLTEHVITIAFGMRSLSVPLSSCLHGETSSWKVTIYRI